jgi:hypothetical protein
MVNGFSIFIKEQLKKKKKLVSFCPHELQRFDTFPHELLTMTLNPIKLPSYDIFPHSVSQKG